MGKQESLLAVFTDGFDARFQNLKEKDSACAGRARSLRCLSEL
jgi:hypothetical protein